MNKINNKVIQPIVYKNSKEKELEQKEVADQRLTENEVEKIRQAVLKEINQIPVEPKKKKIVIFKKLPSSLPKIKLHFFENFKKINLKGLGLSILKISGALIFFLFIITTIGIYLAGWQGGWSKTLTKIIPFPAVYINGNFISANKFLTDILALENYLQRNKMVFTQESIRNKVITNLIEKEIIRQLAKDYGIMVTDKEINEELSQSVLKQTTREQLNQVVQELYHWDFQEYVNKVIMPLVLSKKVREEFNQRSGNLNIKKQMEQYHQQLIGSPASFEEIATTVNQDEIKAVAGDLGWFKLGEISPELELALFNLKNNEFSEVIETDAGYYIIKLKERVINEENQPFFHASQIFLKKSSFQAYLDEQIKKATIVTLIKI